jgi:hypothetical protein
MGIDAILLPDLSDNLDNVYAPDYDRLPGGGTPLFDIAQMGGAKMTIELSSFVEPQISPGKFLEERCGVPCVRMNPPMSLADTDAFIRQLIALGALSRPTSRPSAADFWTQWSIRTNTTPRAARPFSASRIWCIPSRACCAKTASSPSCVQRAACVRAFAKS